MNSRLLAFALLAYLGCTPYARHSFLGGYSDYEVSPGIFRVEVRGNAFTSVERLAGYFQKRIREVCSDKGLDVEAWVMDAQLDLTNMGHTITN